MVFIWRVKGGLTENYQRRRNLIIRPREARGKEREEERKERNEEREKGSKEGDNILIGLHGWVFLRFLVTS